VNDPDQALVWSNGIDHGPPERLWDDDQSAAAEELPAVDPTETLTSLGFITAALRRKAWLWCFLAVVGLLIGSGLYLKFPPSYKATTTLLMKNNPAEDPANAMTTDETLAQSVTVATQVLHELGLRQSAASFIAASSVTAPTDQVLVITVSAPSSNDAIRQASALATAFLQFRADYLRRQQQLLATQVNQQVQQAEQRIDSIAKQISLVSAQSASPAQQAKLRNLEAQSGAQSGIMQNALVAVAAAQTTTTSMVNGSVVVDSAASSPRSHVKEPALYVAGGLIAGLAVGMGIVIVSALTSDRLRRRDDVAEAIGARVRLSVGPLHASRGTLGLRGRASRDRDMKRVIAHLRSVVPTNSHGTVGLAIVAVDNAGVAASAAVPLAVSWAREGKKVVVADLADGALANRLGAKASGVNTVSVNGEQLVAAIPDPGDIIPLGPLQPEAQDTPAGEELLAACASADRLLSLSILDPAFGAEHLATWATDVVVMVTAGRSSAATIHAVGEMIRLAGTRLVSVILIGADEGDESLGVIRTQGNPARLGVLGRMIIEPGRPPARTPANELLN
jgi:capsular polysaccharide biosynthesis protein